tara:strand:- start:2284 stop:2664 length:381 start_codon:yes stop_codon:yes gene_type:complete
VAEVAPAPAPELEAAPVAEPGEEATAMAARRTRRRRAPREETPAPAPMEAEPEEEVAGTGFLTLDTIPWSEVRLGSRVLGTTPIRAVELPEGSHMLTLVNPERGLRTRYQVTIRAGQTVTRRVGLE